MKFQIQTSSGVPIYEQLAAQIRQAVALGQLQSDDRLPSVRQLSRDLLINPNTVARTYQELEGEGLLVCRPGLGVFVGQPRADITREARKRRLLEPLDQWLTMAVHLGCTQDDVLQLVTDRLEHFQWKSPANQAR